MTKRGISTIVATVLILLITVAAVTILWVVILPLITNNLEAGSFDTRLEIITSGGYTVYDSSSGILDVQVKQTGEASRIQIIVLNEGNSKTFNVSGVPGDNQKKKYRLNLSEQFSSLGEIIYIKAVPYIFVNEKSEKQGSPSGQAEVKSSVVPEEPECTSDRACNDENECTNEDTQACIDEFLGECEGEPLADGSSCDYSGLSGVCVDVSCKKIGCEGLNEGDICYRMSQFAGYKGACHMGECSCMSDSECDDNDPCTYDGCGGMQYGCHHDYFGEGYLCSTDEGTGYCRERLCHITGIPDNSINAFWRFENSGESSVIWNPYIPQRNLTLYGGASYGEGHLGGKSLLLANNAGADYAETSSAVLPVGVETVSFGGWVKINSGNIGGINPIVSGQNYGMGFDPAISAFVCSTNNSWNVSYQTTIGVWHSVFCTYSYAGRGGVNASLYVDGQLRNSTIFSRPYPVTINAPFRLGSISGNLTNANVDDFITIKNPSGGSPVIISAANIAKFNAGNYTLDNPSYPQQGMMFLYWTP